MSLKEDGFAVALTENFLLRVSYMLFGEKQCAFQDAFATLFDFETSEKGTNADLKVISHNLLQTALCICILYLLYLNTDSKIKMRQHEASRKHFCFVVFFLFFWVFF